MKTALRVLLALTLLACVASALDAHHHIIVLAGALILSPEAFKDMIAGYLDGLLNIGVRGQLDQCNGVTAHAQSNFSKSVDKLREVITNWWEPFTNKIAAFHDSIYWILQITPGMVNDLQHCPILTVDTHILEDWSSRHHDPAAFAQQFLDNLNSHIFAITGSVMSTIQSLADQHFYDFGHGMGSIVRQTLN